MKERFSELSYSDAPKIVVKPPGPKSLEILEREKEYVAPLYGGGMVPVWAEGRGATLKDVDGNIYIDFTAGHHVTNVGHGNREVIEAVKRELDRLQNVASDPHELRYLAAKKISEVSPPGLKLSAFFCSGSDAVDRAVMLARRYTGKHDIVSFYCGFHGHSFLTNNMGRSIGDYTLMTKAPGHIKVPGPTCHICAFKKTYPECELFCFDYMDYTIKGESNKEVAAIVVCPERQMVSGPDEYMARLREYCEKNDILFISEEVAAGFGRIGKFFGCQIWNITPDIMCIGKAMGSGIPTSGIVTKEDLWKKGSIPGITTYGMNPISCAAVIATIDYMKEKNLPEHAAMIGAHMTKRINEELAQEHEIVERAIGRGLWLGMHLVKDKKTREQLRIARTAIMPSGEIREKCSQRIHEKGLHGGLSFWTPPLVLTKSLADKGLSIINEVISEYEKGEL